MLVDETVFYSGALFWQNETIKCLKFSTFRVDFLRALAVKPRQDSINRMGVVPPDTELGARWRELVYRLKARTVRGAVSTWSARSSFSTFPVASLSGSQWHQGVAEGRQLYTLIFINPPQSSQVNSEYES